MVLPSLVRCLEMGEPSNTTCRDSTASLKGFAGAGAGAGVVWLWRGWTLGFRCCPTGLLLTTEGTLAGDSSVTLLCGVSSKRGILEGLWPWSTSPDFFLFRADEGEAVGVPVLISVGILDPAACTGVTGAGGGREAVFLGGVGMFSCPVCEITPEAVVLLGEALTGLLGGFIAIGPGWDFLGRVGVEELIEQKEWEGICREKKLKK